MIKWIKKKISYILCISLVLGIHFIIHCLFKVHIKCDFFRAEWSAGEVLSYYGTILLGWITVYLAYVAVKQTEVANDMNKRLLKMSEMERKAILKINFHESKVTEEENIKYVTICFENITSNKVVECNAEGSNKLLVESNWELNKDNEGGVIVTEFDLISGNGLIEENKRMEFTFEVKKYSSPFLFLSFKTVSKTIYDLETVQYYNVILIKNTFMGYTTLMAEEDSIENSKKVGKCRLNRIY